LLNDTVCLYSGETKNDEGRTVALTRECLELVVELGKGKQPEDYLLLARTGSLFGTRAAPGMHWWKPRAYRDCCSTIFGARQ
jgi:hypothetical protein